MSASAVAAPAAGPEYAAPPAVTYIQQAPGGIPGYPQPVMYAPPVQYANVQTVSYGAPVQYASYGAPVQYVQAPEVQYLTAPAAGGSVVVGEAYQPVEYVTAPAGGSAVVAQAVEQREGAPMPSLVYYAPQPTQPVVYNIPPELFQKLASGGTLTAEEAAAITGGAGLAPAAAAPAPVEPAPPLAPAAPAAPAPSPTLPTGSPTSAASPKKVASKKAKGSKKKKGGWC